MKWILTLIGAVFGALGLAATWKDITAADRPWHLVGEVWFEWAPTSLQATEAIISRYLDPCSLFHALDCDPFLWHPVLFTALEWYAAPTFFLLGLGFALIGRWLAMRRRRRG